MKIALLGYGLEGKATERYFKNHYDDLACDIFEHFTPEEIAKQDFTSYDYVFRSPSVPPLRLKNETSVTKYFFDHCPCRIIGVTGTKGKGTTCSLIKAILDSQKADAYLVGNIGEPSINVLDNLTPDSIIVYEMSSFQLWDLTRSPSVAVVLRIEADHLNVHHGYADYVAAKGHIAEFQHPEDSIVFFRNNASSREVADKSPARHFPYPAADKSPALQELLDSLGVPGDHNKENAEAALLAVSAFYNAPLGEFLAQNFDHLKHAFGSFQGLPHHLEFVRTLNGVYYYDDSFSASYPSLDVALKAFPGKQIVLIAGGKDRGLDLTPIKTAIFSAPNLIKAILIGETSKKLAAGEDPTKFTLATTLEEAVTVAKSLAETTPDSIVLLSPGAASFDMFKDFYDRGEQFKQLVKGL